MYRDLIALFLLAAGPAVAAADLAKIERRIGKEPAYQSKAPQYCLLVFGPKADTRVWLVVDGDVLYADRNGNGDLTDKSERVERTPDLPRRRFEVGDIVARDGKTRYRQLSVSFGKGPGGSLLVIVPLGDGSAFQVAGYMSGDWGSQPSSLVFAARPEEAPVVHLHGPLTLGPGERAATGLSRTGKNGLWVAVGTPGLGKGTFATVHAFHEGPLDFSGVPRATVEFPNRDPKGKPIVVEVALRHHD